VVNLYLRIDFSLSLSTVQFSAGRVGEWPCVCRAVIHQLWYQSLGFSLALNQAQTHPLPKHNHPQKKKKPKKKKKKPKKNSRATARVKL